MTIKIAKSAGFCFGVGRIVTAALKEAAKGKVYTLGPVIHNKRVVAELAEKGVEQAGSAAELAGRPPGTVIIRSHGVPPEVYKDLEAHAINWLDYTCPDVKRVQEIVEGVVSDGRKLIIIGDANHPEIVGINGCADYGAIILNNLETAGEYMFSHEEKYTLVAQTTFDAELYNEIIDYLTGLGLDIDIRHTLCRGTAERYKEAGELAREVDLMIVLGDSGSSNSLKLFDICKRNQINTIFIENIREIEEKLLNILFDSDKIIGVTAGASTSPAMIKEAVKLMSEINPNPSATADNPEGNFENMIAGVNMVLRTGETVRGKVIKVANGEVFVDLGYKSDGIIQKGQYSDDADADPAKDLKPGDEIDVYVARVNDGEGNVLLSKKHADGRKSMLDLEAAFKNGTPLPGKITEIVKGGCIALIQGVRTFVPSSQAAQRFVADLNELKGKEFNFSILEFDKKAKRIVAGRKELAAKEAQEQKDKAFAMFKIGDKLTGKVSRIAQFGAFVDLGGVDGLIHISEMSWGRIRRVTDVVKEGNEVTVVVIALDPDKGKISLSLKDVTSDPWAEIEERYPVGSIVDGKVARIASFGAFVELEDGVDGLVHISQVAGRHIEKVEEELKIGQIIKVKITAIDKNQKRISLSKKVADNEIYFDYLDDENYGEAYDEVYDEAYDEVYDEAYDETGIIDDPPAEEPKEDFRQEALPMEGAETDEEPADGQPE
ncbi:MAG: bifunctional 4-hydroxy-3-methylbut-2-enyl diphosphate reductase/30S ribosomal protein S1 [Defluviitaleaceae bacterium]|nr:bifunctional 4-hydroxy-3-methylbut-2-enyl diphosphate reductase/30S ribosomal protein S1 [Defluviitaleaceae bacterium]MCL2835670.1 bifunctional 4-hydroxy-3-methylbut-2-enyl diphosphate reductase/30S ribosomal protein S1 [Defluviitaleaceae bacterium]